MSNTSSPQEHSARAKPVMESFMTVRHRGEDDDYKIEQHTFEGITKVVYQEIVESLRRDADTWKELLKNIRFHYDKFDETLTVWTRATSKLHANIADEIKTMITDRVNELTTPEKVPEVGEKAETVPEVGEKAETVPEVGEKAEKASEVGEKAEKVSEVGDKAESAHPENYRILQNLHTDDRAVSHIYPDICFKPVGSRTAGVVLDIWNCSDEEQLQHMGKTFVDDYVDEPPVHVVILVAFGLIKDHPELPYVMLRRRRYARPKERSGLLEMDNDILILDSYAAEGVPKAEDISFPYFCFRGDRPTLRNLQRPTAEHLQISFSLADICECVQKERRSKA